MKQIMAVVVLLLATWSLQAQQACPPPKLVKTTGTAEVKVTPDRVVMQLGVEQQSNKASSAKAAVSGTSRNFLAALKGLGIDEKDIQTAYLFLQPETHYQKGVRMTTFAADQSLSVTIRDLSKLDDVMDAVIAAGGNQIDGIEYQSSELRRYKDQARDEAVKAAREKAEALAKGLGNRIGNAYSMEEVRQSEGYYAYGGLAANTVVEAGTARAAASASL
jgi:uncharacterized protein